MEKTVNETIDNLNIVISELIETTVEMGRELPVAMSESLHSSNTDVFAVSKYILKKQEVLVR